MICTPLKKLVWLTACFMYAQSLHASTVRDDIDYQYFRDFAENKGQFVVGAKNLEIIDVNGQSVGTALPDVPMPDFAVISRRDGVATLVDTQYLASVQHNQGYKTVQFGDHSSENPDAHHFDYQVVERNLALPINQTPRTTHAKDYHAPRLHKLVTEVDPIASTGDVNANPLTNKDRYSAMARAGSGRQYVVNDAAKKTQLSPAYKYLTGGTPLPKDKVWYDTLLYTRGIPKIRDQAMNTALESGDSGSALLVWDTQKQQWLHAGAAQSAADGFNVYIAMGQYVAQKAATDTVGTIDAQNATLNWQSQDSISTIAHPNGSTEVPLFDGTASNNFNQKAHPDNQQLHKGKSFTLTGDNNTLVLAQSINQGAGAIYFDSDTTVKSDTDASWQGAGVVIAPDKTVNWQIKNQQGDRLSKLGKCKLKVSGTGINQGDISVGDGVVVLDQKENDQGQKQAFNKLGIVSGRGKVVVGDSNQMNWDNLYFGFRGGVLDVNGNSLTFSHIQNTDEGAKIVNNAKAPATISVTGRPGQDKLGFNGSFLGDNLNIHYTPTASKNTWLLTGNGDITGTLSATNGGTVILSGRPTPHAYDVLKNKEVIKDDDWQTRTFKAGTYQADNAHFVVGRNVQSVTGDFVLKGTASAKLGFSLGDDICMRSDRTGQVSCNPKIDSEAVNALPITQIIGNLTLDQEAKATIGSKAHLTGKASGNGDITLNPNSHWTLTEDSSAGNLSLNEAIITLSGAKTAHNTLSVQRLQGTGQINFSTDINAKLGDKVLADTATGKFLLSVEDTGEEPTHGDRLLLMSVKQPENLQVSLANADGVVDKGAYRYTLLDDKGDYRLYSSALEQKLKADKERLEQERLEKERLEQERLERERLERDRLEKERLERERLERERLEKERLEKERLEKERLEKERLERERLERERLEKERLERERLEKERLEKERLEQERLDKERLEKERLEKKRLEKERLEKERLEQDRLDKERLEKERLEKEKLETERLEKERLEKERLEAQKQADIISRYSNAALVNASLNRALLSHNAQNLNRHLLDASTAERQIWASGDTHLAHQASDLHRGYTASSQFVQIGIDVPIDHDNLAGVAWSTGSVKTTFEHGEQDTKLNTLFAYTKHKHKHGFVATDAAIVQIDGSLDSSRTSVQFGTTFGTELTAAGILIKPYAGARGYYTPKANYTIDKAVISQPSSYFYEGFGGVRLGKSFEVGSATITPSLATHLRQSYGSGKLSVNGHHFKYDTPKAWTYEVGLNIKINKTSIQLSATHQKDGETHGQAALSYRW